jgi:hypothetical protein
MKNKIVLSLLLLWISCTVFFCNSSIRSENGRRLALDSVKRPVGVSLKATLINLGSEDLPVYQWVDYGGKLKYQGKEYPHIYGFKYFDHEGKLLSTTYYENMEIRNGLKAFDAFNSKVRPHPGDATIEVSNANDTLLFFHVLETDEFKRVYDGIEYKRMPAVYFETDYDIGFTSDEDIEFNVKKDNEKYILTFTGLAVPFKLCSSCKEEPSKFSFLNGQEGRIYFIEKQCYLELMNSEDLKKIHALKR